MSLRPDTNRAGRSGDGALRPRAMVMDDPRRGVFKVDRAAYCSPEILALEQQRVFDRCWLYIGHESEVPAPGDFRARTIAGRPLILIRGSDGRLRVLVNSCTHRGAEVCRAREGNSRTFQCFYHAWTYDNRGELVGVPDAAGYAPDFERARMGLRSVPRLASYRGLVFISFDPEIVAIEEYLAGARAMLDLILDQAADGMEIVGGTHDYSVRANWKMLAENSTDHSHGLPTHQTYFMGYLPSIGVDMQGALRHFECIALGNGHAAMEYNAPWGRPVADWQPRWGEEARLEIEAVRARLEARFGAERANRIASLNRNLVIYPNLVINDIMALVVRTFYPNGPDAMTVSAWAMAPRGEGSRWRALRLDNFLTFLGPGGYATPDDIEAMESCQRSYRACGEVQWSEMSRGMYGRTCDIADDETLRVWWRKWRDQMTQRPGRRKARVTPRRLGASSSAPDQRSPQD